MNIRYYSFIFVHLLSNVLRNSSQRYYDIIINFIHISGNNVKRKTLVHHFCTTKTVQSLIETTIRDSILLCVDIRFFCIMLSLGSLFKGRTGQFDWREDGQSQQGNQNVPPSVNAIRCPCSCNEQQIVDHFGLSSLINLKSTDFRKISINYMNCF